MADGSLLPDEGPPVRAVIVHESERARVTRLPLPGRTVIRKEPLGPDSHTRLQHEVAMLQRVRGVGGLAQVLDEPRFAGSIVLADAGDESLAALPKPLPAKDLIALAVKIAGAVAGMHDRGVIHRDISPANIVVADDSTPCLVDFGLAMLTTQVTPESTRKAEIVGTPAYLAPEQTGRTGRSVDQRADLYALGATLYELATGEPPFGSGDMLRLIHDHLAQVPLAPAQRNSSMPQSLSTIIMHLLEKEPDNRYQSAEGLKYDLERLNDARRQWIGGREFPVRLLRPSRLVGRDDEVTALRKAFSEALAGRCRCVLVSGAPGVGKTALLDELRPLAAEAGGWFVGGKFDEYRRDLESDAVGQALGALGGLLLAEPETKLADVRDRLLAVAGPNAGLLAAAVPEFASVLGIPADAGETLTAQARAQQNGAKVFRAIASPSRPVIVFLDDLQWAARTPLGVVDGVLSEDPIDGLLVVATYRDEDVAHNDLLAATLSRWHVQPGVEHLRLLNLPAARVADMVADMLGMDSAAVGTLAEIVAPQTSGNPYEVVEVLNALRGQGVLTPTAAGWTWDDRAVRAQLDRSDTAELMAARVRALPAPTQEIVQTMACLGGRSDLKMLAGAVAEPGEVVEARLAPALEDGVLMLEPTAGEAVRFGHDRIREAVLAGLGDDHQRNLHLTIARRLSAVPEVSAVAAQQYLHVIDAVDDPEERSHVVQLMRRAAEHASLIGDYSLVSTLLEAALSVADSSETDTFLDLHIARHAALYGLGRLDEAEEEYRTIEAMCRDPVELAEATAVQVRSLTHSNRLTQAVALGLKALEKLGIAVPSSGEMLAELDDASGYMRRWLDAIDAADDSARRELTDPKLLSGARVINAVLPAAYFVLDAPLVAWLSRQALRIWLDHGPAPALVGPAAHTPFAAAAPGADYALSYRVLRRVLALSEARGYEAETSQARFLFALLMWWFEPLEDSVGEARRAREGLINGGDLDNAAYTYCTTMQALLDCAPSLDACVAGIDAALAFIRRIGSGNMVELLQPYQSVVDALRSQGSTATGEAAPTARVGSSPLALLVTYSIDAMAAAVFGDQDALERHTAEALPLLGSAPGTYPSAVARVLRGLAVAGRLRLARGDEADALQIELEELTRWLADRATDAPQNFLHLLRLIEAERAWAVGDFQGGVRGFDAALREGSQRRRPWHQAMIAERAASFFLAHGIDHIGYDLMAQARQRYADWGATAKAAQLDWSYPSLPPPSDALTAPRNTQSLDDSLRSGSVSTGTIDLLGILSASQALSSQTSFAALHSRVAEVLAAMTGATDISLLLWRGEHQDWLLPARNGDAGALTGETAPMSVLRYVERTREPLAVADATRDDRFARDPYFADTDCCSLLAVPILSRGRLRALLVLENRLMRAAFTAERLSAVNLIAGQLAVSLDNAQLYTELAESRARIVATADQTRRRIERNLHDGAQQQLVSLALELRMAQADVPPEEAGLRTRLGRAVDQANGALEELRNLSRGIHPAMLGERGLGPALRAVIRRSPIPVQLEVQVRERLPEQVEVSAYYIIAEALTNAAKHSCASTITVIVDQYPSGGGLRLLVSDDGIGGAAFSGGTGLVGLKDRAEALGGDIDLHSSRGAGTTLRVTLPFTRPDPRTATDPHIAPEAPP